jgi:iron complex transport system substrate-binding protein
MTGARAAVILVATAVVATGAAHAGNAAPPSRIASINLCTDQHLLALGEPSQIKGLSPFARDAARSHLAGRAAGYPVLSGYAEDVLALAPDLVVAGRFSRRATRELLRRKGVRVVEFDVADTIDEVKRQIEQFGELIGRREAAARQIAAIDEALARARAAQARTKATALAVQRRGWVSGEKSLTTSLLDVVGLRNAAGAAGVQHGQLMPLESIIAMQPDLLLVTSDDSRAEDQGRAMLLHPAITKRYPRERMIVLPESLTVCGGAMLVEALDALTSALAKLQLR